MRDGAPPKIVLSFSPMSSNYGGFSTKKKATVSIQTVKVV